MGKWTEEAVTQEIYKVMEMLNIKRMPTCTELRGNKRSGLLKAITLSGGIREWAKKLNLPFKEKTLIWNDERIYSELKKCIKILQISRMPTARELAELGRNDLHCAITKHDKKYRGWANELGLSLKESETKKGNKYEEIIMEKIHSFSSYQLKVKRMTTTHPYDLLINGCVKVDVKSGSASDHSGKRVHYFSLGKKYATCDVYICVALDEEEKTEKIFIFPSAHAQTTGLAIGEKSQYDKYINNWDFLYNFVNQYERALW